MAGEQGEPGDAAPEEAPLDPNLGILDRPGAGRPRGLDEGEVRERSRAGLVAITTVVLLPGLAVLVAVLLSLSSGPPSGGAEPAADQELVRRWCTWTAADQPGYDRCLQDADPRVVRREDSDAGRFARSELLRCTADAGPLCVTR